MKPEPLMERMGCRLGKMLVRSINLRDLFAGDERQSINAEVRMGRELR
jgi:hypothetical protein